MSRRDHWKALILVGLATVVSVVSACSDSRDALAPVARAPESATPGAAPSPAARVALDCLARLGTTPTVACTPARGSAADARGRTIAYDVIMGRQNIDVTLAFSGFRYKVLGGGKAHFSFNVTLHNLLNQPLGTTDGQNPAPQQTRVFVYSGPSVTTGKGTIAVSNPTGFSTFTQSNQAYFQYASPIQPGATTPATSWIMQLDTAVHGFQFSVEIDAPLPAEKSVRRWTLLRQGLTSDSLTGVWQHTASDVFAVGLGGTLLNYNGSAWNAISFGSASTNYRAVSGLVNGSAATVFAVGDNGTVARDSAGTWSSVNSGTTSNLYGVWTSAPGQTFAVGAGATIIRSWFGGWFGLPAPGGIGNVDLRGVWGADGSHIWIVGDNGTILFSNNGIFWNTQASPTTASLTAVWGTSATNVFAVGAQGTILHFDGTTWTALASGSTANLSGVGGASATDVWAVGAAGTTLHYNGSAWSVVGPHAGMPLSAVAAGSSTPWAVGAEGSLLSFDGARWQVSLQSGLTLNAVWASSASDVWVATLGTMLHYDGSTWTNAYAAPGDSLTGVWGAGAQPSALYTVGTDYGAQYTSGAWLGSGLPYAFTSVTGSGSSAYAAARGGTVATWSGSGSPSYRQITTGDLTAIWAVTGSGSTTVFAASSNDSVFVNSGSGWSGARGPAAGQQMLGVFGSSASDVYAVGTAGTIGHYTSKASGWTALASGTGVTLRGGWADAPQGSYTADAYAVGDGGTVQHYNGKAWLTMPTPVTTTLRGAYGTSATNLYVVGDNGVVLLGSQ